MKAPLKDLLQNNKTNLLIAYLINSFIEGPNIGGNSLKNLFRLPLEGHGLRYMKVLNKV